MAMDVQTQYNVGMWARTSIHSICRSMVVGLKRFHSLEFCPRVATFFASPENQILDKFIWQWRQLRVLDMQ